MPRSPIAVSRRERNAADKRERILAATRKLLERLEFSDLAVEAITVKADVAKGTFFTFFPTKRDVLLALYARLEEGFARLLESLDGPDPLKALDGLYKAAEKMLRTEGASLPALTRAVFADRDVAALDVHSARDDIAAYAAFLTKCKAAGTVRRSLDARRGGEVLSHIWSGTVLMWADANMAFALAPELTAKAREIFAGFDSA